ncbi:polymer-forming cytoskeletal protein [Halioglobus maricola]|uniref:Polymer-forming cytoskeletal protein n=1 Tax=Halioglobus maricola TaxID=2601894 RepID=A0A5P9NHM3_9GAMM|nr:polymer-forming cytoskeletal protein [Halioglobus maricola]QFU74518.1 polymer-forming cytoskeletal protein [Halioglobus maricola]
MWGNKRTKFSASAGTTLVARDTTVVGDMHFSGCLEIEGVVQGNLVADEGSKAEVSIADGGRVEGEIRAPIVVINGVIEGDVYSTERLELAPRGRVHGNVHYALLEMEAGSEVNGSLTHKAADEQQAPAQLDHSVEVTELGESPAAKAESPSMAKVD